MSQTQPDSAESLVFVARAVRVRGLKGEIVAELLTDFPERFASIKQLIALTPSGEQKVIKLSDYWFQKDRIVLSFDGYDDVDAAKTLVGYKFAVPESDRVPLPEDHFYDWELEGCLVETVSGNTIGTVREVMRTGGVEVLVIEDENARDYLIPMAASIVVKIDAPAKRIVIDPPEGLLEL
jgi:16S rRNA processing protein RimM